MAFTNRSVFDQKCNQAIRAILDLRSRAEGYEFVNMDDAAYLVGGVEAILDGVIALNATCTTKATRFV